MKKNEIIDLISQQVQVVCELKDVPSIEIHAPLFETYILDSTLLIELLYSIEEKLNISLELEEIEPENLDSIHSLATYISSLIS